MRIESRSSARLVIALLLAASGCASLAGLDSGGSDSGGGTRDGRAAPGDAAMSRDVTLVDGRVSDVATAPDATLHDAMTLADTGGQQDVIEIVDVRLSDAHDAREDSSPPKDAHASSCEAGAPYCATSSDCVAPGGCHTAACVAGCCGVVSSAEGTKCATGVCNGAGECVECLSPNDCSTMVCHEVLCQMGVCAYFLEAFGSACDAGTCNGSGVCAPSG